MLKRLLIVVLLTTSCSLTYAAVPDAAETAATHFHTGLAYERLGRLEEAYTELQLACALASDNARMALALGVVATRLGRLDVAQRSLEHSITLDANSIASYYQLAYLYEKIGAKDRAVDSWHRFFELNQDEALKQEARKHLQLLEVLKTPAAGPTSSRRASPAGRAAGPTSSRRASPAGRAAGPNVQPASLARWAGGLMKRWIGLAILLSACSSPAVVKPPLEKIEKIQRIAVQPFEGTGGAEVTQALLKMLAGSGLVVVDVKKGPDAILTGSVSEYRTGRKVMIILGNSHSVAPDGQKIDLSNPVVSLNASPLQNPALGNPQMVSEHASVRALAKLVDVPSGNMLWVGESSYESLELPGALQTVANVLVQALQEAAPRLQHRKPSPR